MTYNVIGGTLNLAQSQSIKRCLSGESDVVRFIAQYSILYGGMVSCIGQNILTYSKHYQLPASYLLSHHCTASKIDEICKSWVKPGTRRIL